MNIDRRELIQRLATGLAGLTTAATLSSLLSACEKAQAATRSTQTANLFSPYHIKALDIISDIILPKTDTPGAIDVGVPGYIRAVVSEIFTFEDQENFRNGMFSLDLLCMRIYEKNFVELPAHKQQKLIRNLNLSAASDDDAIKQVLLKKSALKTKVFDNALHYFSIVKELSIFGFYTSEIGATQVLHYNPMPGRFDGCVALKDIGKTWATPR